MLALLEEFGGIYIEDLLTLTEPLSWLTSIHKQIYVNSVDKEMPIQFFSFHNPMKSSKLIKQNSKRSESRQNIRINPALQSFFIASYRRT